MHTDNCVSNWCPSITPVFANGCNRGGRYDISALTFDLVTSAQCVQFKFGYLLLKSITLLDNKQFLSHSGLNLVGCSISQRSRVQTCYHGWSLL